MVGHGTVYRLSEDGAMSMTVQIATQCTDVELLKEALRQMGVVEETERKRRVLGRPVEVSARVHGRTIGFTRGRDGSLDMVGDGQWRAMRDDGLLQRIHQQYAVAGVRRKAESMGFRVASVTQKEDGTISLVARSWS
jgi:hypothetical protein